MKHRAFLVAALYLLVVAALTVPVLLTLGTERSSESPQREAFLKVKSSNYPARSRIGY